MSNNSCEGCTTNCGECPQTQEIMDKSPNEKLQAVITFDGDEAEARYFGNVDNLNKIVGAEGERTSWCG